MLERVQGIRPFRVADRDDAVRPVEDRVAERVPRGVFAHQIEDRDLREDEVSSVDREFDLHRIDLRAQRPFVLLGEA